MAAKLYLLYALGIVLLGFLAGAGILLALINGDWRWLLTAFPFAFLLSQLLNPRG